MMDTTTEQRPDGTTVVTVIADDGTVTATTYDADGETVDVVDLPPVEVPAVEAVDPTIAVLAGAEAARRAAYDAVISGGTLTLARSRDADRAGSDAFGAYLAAHL